MIRRLPTKGETRRVARRTVETLEGGGYRCCVFGGLACSIWGMDNRPVKVSDYHAYWQWANLVLGCGYRRFWPTRC